jgi:hypothetical protein
MEGIFHFDFRKPLADIDSAFLGKESRREKK